MANNRWSYSRFNLAESCLRLYHSRYEVPIGERLPELYDPLRETGKGVHACIDEYKDHLKAIGAAQDMTVTDEIVEQYFSTDPEVVSTQHYLDVLLVFRAFAEGYRHNPDTYYGGEFLSSRTLPESDIEVEGFPDHIEAMSDKTGAIVVSEDVKAGYSTTVTASNRLQGEIEAWRLLEALPETRVGWRVAWPRAGTKSPIHEFKPGYARALEARLRSIVARVDHARVVNRWPATPGSACTYCPLASNCRERIVLAELDVIATDRESAKKAANDLVLLDAAYKQRFEQTKAWTDAHGPIPAGIDKEAGFVKKTSGAKIGDVELLVRRLGEKKAEADGVEELDSAEIIEIGLEVAVKENLVSINGKKTSTKGVQNDARFHGLWVPGESKMQFDVYNVARDEVVE